MLTMHTLLALLIYYHRLTESANPDGARGGECKQSRDSYVKLMPVQKAQIAKYALASSNKARIHERVSENEFGEHAERKICNYQN